MTTEEENKRPGWQGDPPTPRNVFAARFAAWLRDALDAADMTVGELATAATAEAAPPTKISAAAMWTYLNGTRIPSIEAVDAIGAALGITLSDFGCRKKNSRKRART